MTLEPVFLVVDKPPDLTSHDVVAIVRAVTGVRKVGHTGTLDPFATGVLPLAIGAATRLIRYLDEEEKIYDATIKMGTATETGDPTGRVTRTEPVPELEPDRVQEVLNGFIGERLQVPHPFSAVKVDGKRLYEYARRGQRVKVEPRLIKIFAADLLSVTNDEIRVLWNCSRGTYARVLADDVAVALGTAGHLKCLTRRRSGSFSLEQAISLPRLSEIVARTPDWKTALRPGKGADRVEWRPREQVHEELGQFVIRPIDALRHIPLLPVSHVVARAVCNGAAAPAPPAGIRPGGRYLLVFEDRLVAIAASRGAGSSNVIWRSPAFK